MVKVLQRIGDKWRNLNEGIRRRRYFIEMLKGVGCLRFRDRFRIMFARDRDLGKIQCEVIDRLSKIYEKVFFSFDIDKARSSVRNVGEVVKAAQNMIEGNDQPPN